MLRGLMRATLSTRGFFFFSRVWRESSVLAEGKSHERRSREKNERDSIMKTWQTPKPAQKKSLAPRV